MNNNKIGFGAASFAVAVFALSQVAPAGAAGLAPSGEAPAPVETPVVPAKRWAVEVDPFYSWVPGMRGDLRVFGGPGVNVNVTTGDILNNLGDFLDAIEGIYMGSGEIRYDRFGFQWDAVYLDLGASREFGNRITGYLDTGFGFSMTTLGANYRIYDAPNAFAAVIGGLRVTDVHANLNVRTPGPIFGSDRSGGDTWVDPVIGVKGRYELPRGFFVKGSALVGGFGVSSDYLYDVTGLVGYEFNDTFELYGGWRISHTDYQNGAFVWDMQLSGPMTGFTLKF